MKKIITGVGFLGLLVATAVNAQAAYFNSAPIARCETQITRTLQKGSENNDVFVLQQMLVNAGYLNARPNGYFGNQTAQAVRAFQRNNSLPVTGMVGASTRDAVNERLCDVDLIDNQYNDDGYYGYQTGTTYVGQIDPFVKVITPAVSTPSVYATPQGAVTVTSSSFASSNLSPSFVASPVSGFNNTIPVSGQVTGTSIIYNPAIGYTYGITQQSGSITVGSPVANSYYKEGDTVFVNWTSNNLQSAPYTILLESSVSGQSKVVTVTQSTSYSFVLTKELLDAVCAGSCNNDQQGSFRVVITTPTTDIAGITSTLRAAIAPITVKRPTSYGQVSVSASKTPVNSGEVFKLYINLPGSSWNNALLAGYSVRVVAVCNTAVTASIAGNACGQDFIIPSAVISGQQEVPVMITSTSWYKQDVTFQAKVVGPTGQVLSLTETKVTVNAAPFGW